MSAKPTGKNPQARIDILKLTTPQGVALWPKLAEPDTTFKEEGEYSVNLVLTEEDATPIIEKAKAHLDKFIAAQAKLLGKKTIAKANTTPWREDEDRETKEPTGNIRLNIKMKASTITKLGKKIDFTPAVFDKYGKPTDASFGSGSLIRVNFEVNPWYSPALGAGVQFRLVAVQVLEARGHSKPTNAAECGFDVVESADLETLADEAGAAPAEASNSSASSGGDF